MSKRKSGPQSIDVAEKSIVRGPRFRTRSRGLSGGADPLSGARTYQVHGSCHDWLQSFFSAQFLELRIDWLRHTDKLIF
jgi:hypothetical protein